MLYRTMKKNSDSLSALGFGCMRFPEKGGKIDEELSEKLLLHAYENGVNYFDTAVPYHMGQSEALLGSFLEKHKIRDKIKIATKLPPWLVTSEDDLDSILNNQLKKLKTDYIDYYLIHALEKVNWQMMKRVSIYEFMNRIKADGRVKNMGFSFHGDLETFVEIIDSYEWDFCQIQYNILDEKNQAGTEGLKYAASKGLGVVIMEPLRGGLLAESVPEEVERIYSNMDKQQTPAGWNFSWILNHPEVSVVLSGMNSVEMLEENIKTFSEVTADSMNDDEIKSLTKVKNTYRELMKVSCTGCRYCMPCPAGVNIPGAFEAYNTKFLHLKKGGNPAFFSYMLQCGGIFGTPAFASQCIECGKCEEHCPQNIEIRNELKNVKKEFEGIFFKPIKWFIKTFMNRFIKKVRKEME